MQRLLPSTLVVLVLAQPASFALAGDPGEASHRGHLSLSVDAFGGGHFFADDANLGVASAPEATTGAKDNALLGLRATLGLGAWAAAEAEVFGMITPDRTYDLRANVLACRLNAIAYLLSGNLRPFALVGAGAIEVAKTYADGNQGLVRDRDGEFHVGVGLDYRLLDFLSVRADARTVEMPGKQNWSLATDFEAMFGVSVGLGRGPRAATSAEPPGATPVAPRPPAAAAPAGQGLTAPASAPPAAAVPAAPIASGPLPVPPSPLGLPPASVEKPVEKAPPASPVVAQPAPPPPSSPSVVPAARTSALPTVKELVARSKEIRFEGSSRKLSLSSLPLIGQLAEALMNEPNVQLEIVAHTARSGDAGKDMTLSRRRADAIKNALVNREVPRSRLTATGRGSEEPIAPNITRAGRKLNERIELRVLGP
jgi:outer membrane protein OmpA-like peptidoglycan-associated protein